MLRRGSSTARTNRFALVNADHARHELANRPDPDATVVATIDLGRVVLLGAMRQYFVVGTEVPFPFNCASRRPPVNGRP